MYLFFFFFFFFWWIVFTSSPGLFRVMLGAEGGGPRPRRPEIADRPQGIGQMLDLLIIWFISELHLSGGKGGGFPGRGIICGRTDMLYLYPRGWWGKRAPRAAGQPLP